jgi:hypothetical protein
VRMYLLCVLCLNHGTVPMNSVLVLSGAQVTVMTIFMDG